MALQTQIKITINEKEHLLELYSIEHGIVTELLFDGRVFIEESKVKTDVKQKAEPSLRELFDEEIESKKNEKKTEPPIPIEKTNVLGKNQCIGEKPIVVVGHARKKMGKPLFDSKEKLGNVGTVTIYRPVVDYLISYLKPTFSVEQFQELLDKFWKMELDRELTEAAQVFYTNAYVKYLEGAGVVSKGTDGDFKKNEGIDAERPMEKSDGTTSRAPDNTSLFLNWLSSNKVKEFDIDDFISKNPTVTMELAQNIIFHQIKKNKLLQLSSKRFRVVSGGVDG